MKPAVEDHAAAGGSYHASYNSWDWYDNKLNLHRINGPARVYLDGRQEWYRHGRRHREAGPAVIWFGVEKRWYWNGQLHRTDGPAAIHPNGGQDWFLHGLLHRVDGPACIAHDGSTWWYVKGRDITGEVKAWMHDNDITWPFTPEQLMEFQLRWM